MGRLRNAGLCILVALIICYNILVPDTHAAPPPSQGHAQATLADAAMVDAAPPPSHRHAQATLADAPMVANIAQVAPGLPDARGYLCGQGALAALSFGQVSPPSHFLASRRGHPRQGIFAELQRGTCDLLPHPRGCDWIESGESLAHPEIWIQDFVDLALVGCDGQCRAMDIGSNLGLVALRILQSGARLVAVEPQLDLCCAGGASAEFNGYGNMSTFLCGAVTTLRQDDGNFYDGNFLKVKGGYRYGRGNFDYEGLVTRLGLPRDVPFHFLPDLLRQGFSETASLSYSFIKVDTETIDCEIIQQLLALRKLTSLSFEAVSFEFSGELCKQNYQFSELLFDLQEDGFKIHRAVSALEVERNKTWAGDAYPWLTETIHTIGEASKLFEFKKFTLEEWVKVNKDFSRHYQGAITRTLLR